MVYKSDYFTYNISPSLIGELSLRLGWHGGWGGVMGGGGGEGEG